MTDHRRSSAPLPSARGDGSCPTGRAADGPVSAGGVGAVRGPRVEPVIIRPVQPGHRIRSTLGAALVCTLVGAAALVTACSASDTGSPPTPTADATSVGTGAVANPSAVIHTITPPEPLTETTPATSTRTTSIAEPSPAVADDDTSRTASTGTSTAQDTVGASPTITYRVTDTAGPFVTLTTNGAVYIIRDQNPVTLAASLVVEIALPVELKTNRAEAEAAIAAYRGNVEVLDRAMHEPTKDWSTELARYAMDPVLSSDVAAVAEKAKQRVRSAGHVAYRGAVTAATPDEVHLRLCNDVRGRDWIDVENGLSVKASQGGRMQEITVTYTSDKRWLVSAIHTETETPC